MDVQEHMKLYQDESKGYGICMFEIVKRHNNLKVLLMESGPPVDVFNIEFWALQIRIIIEYIFLSSLSANKKKFEKQLRAFKKQYQPGKINEFFNGINDKYFPIPFTIEEAMFNDELVHKLQPNVSKNFITKDELINSWNSISNFLHAKNPFKEKRDYSKLSTDLQDILDKISELLEIHSVLLNGINEVFICQIPFRDGDTITVTYAKAKELLAQERPQ